jgi:hypothetical protein
MHGHNKKVISILWSYGCVPAFRINMLPPSSGLECLENILKTTQCNNPESNLNSCSHETADYGLDDRGSIPDRGRGFFF